MVLEAHDKIKYVARDSRDARLLSLRGLHRQDPVGTDSGRFTGYLEATVVIRGDSAH